MRIKFLSIIAAMIVLAGCTTVKRPTGSTDSLEGLEGLGVVSVHTWSHNKPINQIRLEALRETATSLGAQSALALRAHQINAGLEHNNVSLNATYNFYAQLLHNNILPPVLVEANNTLNLADPDTIRLSEKMYKIIKQARFVTAPPTWRDYLWMNDGRPPEPESVLLPKNRQERDIWVFYIRMGWQHGIILANNIYSANLARLNRDYKGMLLYRKLYEQNMVSAPFVAKTDLGITGTGSQMSIGDKVLRITALPQLNLQGNTWRPALVPSDPAVDDAVNGPPPPQEGNGNH